jgi:hypothetical protein
MAAPEMSVKNSLAVDTWAGIYSTTLSDDFNFVTGAGAGAGSHVRVFSGTDGAMRDEFFAYDPDIEDGVRVAQGQIDRDGIHDCVR